MTCWCGKRGCTRPSEPFGQSVAGLSCAHEWHGLKCAKCGATCRRDERGRIVEYTAAAGKLLQGRA